MIFVLVVSLWACEFFCKCLIGVEESLTKKIDKLNPNKVFDGCYGGTLPNFEVHYTFKRTLLL